MYNYVGITSSGHGSTLCPMLAQKEPIIQNHINVPF